MKILNRILASLAVMSVLAIALPANAQPKAFKGLVESHDGRYRSELTYFDLKYSDGKLTGKGSFYFQGEFNRVSPCHRANDEVTGTYVLHEDGEIDVIRFKFEAKNAMCGALNYGFRREKETGDLLSKNTFGSTRLKPVLP